MMKKKVKKILMLCKEPESQLLAYSWSGFVYVYSQNSVSSDTSVLYIWKGEKCKLYTYVYILKNVYPSSLNHCV